MEATRLIDAARLLAEAVQAEQHAFGIPPRALIVGGFVRDSQLGIESSDLDMEVYGVTPERLETLVGELFPGQVNTVGKSFGILKVALGEGLDFDIAVPRRESKSGKGHRGFLIESDPMMSVKDAAKRRDFTINAMASDPLTGELIDPFHGQEDLKAKGLRVTDPERFQDDPLRVYRALQFAARFELTVEPSSLELMSEMVERGDLDELAKERVTEELKKLLLQAEKPSIGFELARELGIIKTYFPELDAMIGTEQEPEWHPEGDVWIHTMMVIDQAAKIIRQPEREFDETEQLQVMLGALCHDLGKPTTTKHLEGRIRSRGHEEAGEEPTRSLFGRLSFSEDIERAAIAIVKDHLKPGMFYRDMEKGALTNAQCTNAVRKLLKRISPVSWRVLIAASEADTRGRTIPGASTEPYLPGEFLTKIVKEHGLDAEPAKPLLQGRDLLELGVQPGALMGKIIEEIERERDDGRITTYDQAISRAREIIERP